MTNTLLFLTANYVAQQYLFVELSHPKSLSSVRFWTACNSSSPATVPVSFFVWKCHPVPAKATTQNSLVEVEIAVVSFIVLFVCLCAFQLQFHSCFVLLSPALNTWLGDKYKSTLAQSGPTRTKQRIRHEGFHTRVHQKKRKKQHPKNTCHEKLPLDR